jgi:hypothetical protein
VKNFLRSVLLAGTASLSLAATTSASTITTWEWILTGGSGGPGSGTLTTDSEACSIIGCPILSIHGTVDGYPITGLFRSPETGSDNLIYYPATSPNQVDYTGIGLVLGSSYETSISIYNTLNTGDSEFITFGDHTTSTAYYASFTVDDPVTRTITPIPAALPLFATGLGALGLLGWRRKRKAQAVAA